MRWFGGAALLLVAVAVGAVALVVVLVGPRPAGYLLAGSLVAVAVARALLPVRVVGSLAVRSRGLDVACALGLAVAVAAMTYVVPL